MVVYLSEVRRRKLKDDHHWKDKDTGDQAQELQANKIYYDLPGEFFVLPFSKIENLHITYYHVEVEKDFRDSMKADGE